MDASWVIAFGILFLCALPSPAAPEEGLDERGLMTLLKDHMAGQPVIAAGVGDIQHGVRFDEPGYARETKILGRLQAIAAAVSDDTETYIPYAVRGAWVIAPETRTEVRTDLTSLPDLQAEGGGLLLDQVVLSLAPDLLQQAGSQSGILVSRLSPDAQKMLALALKPPIKITRSRNGTVIDLNGGRHEGWVYDPVGQVTEPIDVARVRLRARLWIEAADVSVEASHQRLGQQRRHQFQQAQVGGWRNIEAPVETVAANRYKPTDLEGKGFTQPFGASGVMPLGEALRRIAEATGEVLYPGSYARVPVFVGSPAVTCGEMIDGLRLALTGAWRRVGKGYVLCWDRRGLAALNQTLDETSRGLAARISVVAASTSADPRWVDIALKMPFAPDDPLALSDEQRRKLYGEPPAPEAGEASAHDASGIPYPELTPAQQEYLQECGRTDQMDIYPPSGPDAAWTDPQHRPFTPEDVRSATLGYGYAPQVAIEFQLPGFGWVRHVLERGRALDPATVRNARRTAAASAARAGKPSPAGNGAPSPRPQPPAGAFAPRPFTIAAPERGVMVGPLPAARLEAVAAKMAKSRYTTLFYPVLYEGCATFTSRAFPEHPSLKGGDAMAAALAAARAHGLKLVGYLSPIAWRSQRNATHWLDEHPDWLDRDPLGRTRLEWLRRGTTGQAVPPGARDSVRRDTVRPTEPEVRRRLDVLLDEFARTKAAGLLVDEWRPRGISANGRPLSPPLGFSLADRIAVLEKTGIDPLDAIPRTTWADSVTVYPPHQRLLGRKSVHYLAVDQDGFEGISDTPEPDPYAALVDHVLQRARSLRKDWTAYLVADPAGASNPNRPPLPGDPAPKPTPKADRLLAMWDEGDAPDGMVVPDLPWDQADTGGWIPDEVRSHSNLLYLDWSAAGLSRNRKTIVMDFRLRPSSIAEVMKYAR